MTTFILRFGWLSIFMILVCDLTVYAAPVEGREQIIVGQQSKYERNFAGGNFVSSCKNGGGSTNLGYLTTWKETCRSNLSDSINRRDHGLKNSVPDIIWGDILKTSTTVGDFSQCFSRTKTEIPGLQSNCPIMGVSWLHSVTGNPTIQDSFKSLYEYELPDKENHHDSFRGLSLSFSDRQLTRYDGHFLSDDQKAYTVSNVSDTIEYTAFREKGLRNLVFWAPDHQVEVSDTMTKFIPKLSLPTRSVELGDFLVFLFLLLLLPDYKKIRSFFCYVWQHHKFKYQ